MPFVQQTRTAKLTRIPAGFVAKPILPGHAGPFWTRVLVTSDDGPHLYYYLDQLVTGDLAPLFDGIPREEVSSFLINITDREDAKIWINPPVVGGLVMQNRSVKAGEPCYLDDVLQFGDTELGGVDPEPTKGALVYSREFGWRRALYFDFSMVMSEPNRPIKNFRAIIGEVETALLIRDRLRFADALLPDMYEAGWFPFGGLPPRLQKRIYDSVRDKLPIVDIEKEVVALVSPRVPDMVDTWKQKDAFAVAATPLTHAARHFAKGEYRAAHALALPHLEGVLRFLYLRSSSSTPNYAALRKALVVEAARRIKGKSAILPEQFSDFVDTYYLKPFDLAAGVVPTSRHSLLHGVSPGNELDDPVHCVRLFLTLEQIFYCA